MVEERQSYVQLLEFIEQIVVAGLIDGDGWWMWSICSGGGGEGGKWVPCLLWQCLRDCLQQHHCHFITQSIDRSCLSAHQKTNSAEQIRDQWADGGEESWVSLRLSEDCQSEINQRWWLIVFNGTGMQTCKETGELALTNFSYIILESRLKTLKIRI